MPRIALLALLILSCGNLRAQPVNDLCEDAIELDFEKRLDANGVVSLGAVVEDPPRRRPRMRRVPSPAPRVSGTRLSVLATA